MTRNAGRAQCAHTADPCNKASQKATSSATSPRQRRVSARTQQADRSGPARVDADAPRLLPDRFEALAALAARRRAFEDGQRGGQAAWRDGPPRS
jgi:hypothetical protein